MCSDKYERAGNMQETSSNLVSLKHKSFQNSLSSTISLFQDLCIASFA